jgi:hypothetical protein
MRFKMKTKQTNAPNPEVCDDNPVAGEEAMKHADEISSSHGSEYEDGCFLGRCTVSSVRAQLSRQFD